MNNFKLYFILLIASVSILSCSKDDDNSYTPEPLRDYTEQYNTDLNTIKDYLNTHYITVTNAPGQTTDQDVTITKIPAGGTQAPIMSYLNSTSLPSLKTKTVEQDGIEYTFYYLVLREGVGDSPCNVDGVLTSYKGSYLYYTAATATPPSELSSKVFEEVANPSSYLSLFTTITGWGETLPEFKTGNHSFNTNGTVSFTDFGAGVMFLPSGLAYYYNSPATIPPYSPLVFSFKLYDIQRLDQDADGIPSYLEDLDGDGYMRVLPETHKGDRYVDDTDQDGIPNYYDVDDDGDSYTTKLEIKNPATGLPYPFDQIPVSATTGKKIHLDSAYHP